MLCRILRINTNSTSTCWKICPLSFRHSALTDLERRHPVCGQSPWLTKHYQTTFSTERYGISIMNCQLLLRQLNIDNYFVGQAEGSDVWVSVNLRFAWFTALSGGTLLPTVARTLCHFVTSPYTVGSHPSFPPAKGLINPLESPVRLRRFL